MPISFPCAKLLPSLALFQTTQPKPSLTSQILITTNHERRRQITQHRRRRRPQAPPPSSPAPAAAAAPAAPVWYLSRRC